MGALPSHHYDDAVLIAPKSQDAYFRHYRLDHPEERFDLMDLASLEEMFQYALDPKADDFLASCGVGAGELETTKLVIRRLRYAPRIEGLAPYFELKEKLEKNGLLRVKHDPFAYFKSKNIIVRGYPDGRAISEAMQDLPNICVNFDFGQERPREGEAPTMSMKEAVASLSRFDGPVYLLAEKGVALPRVLSDLPRLNEPFPPSEGSFLALKSEKGYFEPKTYPFDPTVLKALRLPSFEETKRRLEVETKNLFASMRLLAIIA